jgi:hypothetical protein
MKKVFVIFLLSIAYVSSFSQTLSKQETVDYIKTRLTKSTSYFLECHEDYYGRKAPCIEDILDVKYADNKLFLTINHKFRHTDFVMELGKDFVATPTSDCDNRVYEIGGFKFVISKDDAESLVKALNYLNKICVDPFK